VKPGEARDAGRAAGDTLRQLTRLVRGVHLAVTDTVHSALDAALGPVARPVLATSDAVATGVYAATERGLDAGARVVGLLVERNSAWVGDHLPGLHDRPGAHHMLAVGAGLRGDVFADRAPLVAPEMQVRRRGARVLLSREGIAQAYEEATPDLVVFLHGLFETEAAWGLGRGQRLPYSRRLSADLGLTPVFVRYNTGLRISRNGRSLAALLDDLVRGWPVPVRRLVLVGHSMGGLVIHSALATAAPEDAWVQHVSDTITLGTPHHGAPAARGVHRAAQGLSERRRGEWLSEVLQLRSVGIRDLAHGNIADADWDGHDPEDLTDRRTHPPVPDGIRHHAVVAIVGPRLPEPLRQLVGDLLVPVDSARHASTEAVTTRFADDRIAVVSGLTHLGLLNDDVTYGHIRRWLTPD